MPETRHIGNSKIAELLREVAAVYEVTREDHFRLVAYQRAADAIEHATSDVRDLWENGHLEEIPGIGKTIASHLDEYFRTGKVRHFDYIKRNLPKGMFEFLRIPGVGPKTAYKIARELKIKTVADLKRAAKAGKIAELSGLGEKSQADIIRSIGEVERRSNRMLLPAANELAESIIKELLRIPGTDRVDALGSLRRRVSTIGDIDLAVSTTKPAQVLERFTKLPNTARILVRGTRKVSVLLKSGCQVDLRVQNPASYGAQLQYFTGSKEHNIHLRTIAQNRHLSLSEYGFKDLSNNKLISINNEAALYRKLGMSWIPPELREDTGEIEAAAEGRLPALVSVDDVKGDLHVHCNYSLEESHDPGSSTMLEIARTAQRLKYEYVSLGNHSPSVGNHTTPQIKTLIRNKLSKVYETRKQVPEVALLNAIEVDILSDGRLALEDSALAMLDLVIVGVHSSLRQEKKVMTARVLAALRNPYVKIFAHPTGRLLLEREGYDLDWELIFRTCLREDKILEINAYPNRLDLPDTLVREAVRVGVPLIINTDAHSVEQMGLMCYGVDTARRGWCEKKDIVNTLSWESFRDRLGLKL